MTLRGIINKHKNAKQGLKYLERKLGKIKDMESEDAKIFKGRIEAKQGRVKFWSESRDKGRLLAPVGA